MLPLELVCTGLQNEMLLVERADAVVDPRAVMVHTADAATADGAMVRARRLEIAIARMASACPEVRCVAITLP